MPKLNSFRFGIAVAVVFMFTLMSAQALMIAPSSKIIYVPDNYSTIQQAVDAASPGDTIIVRDGIYIENIKISKSYLTIKSENGSTNCIVQAADSKDSVFRVSNANYINIIGFTLKSSTEAVHDGGLSLRGAHYCNISCNIILNNRIGISMWSSSNIEINNNIIKSNSYFGIYLHTSDYNTIINNFIESNGQQGIYLSSSGQNILKDNALLNNGIGVHIASVGGNILINNRISGNNYGIYLIDTPSNNLTKNYISNNNYGVYLNGRGGNIFTENNILENGYGVYLDFANHNFFYFNNMMNNTRNIYTHDSNNLWNSTEQIAYTYKGKTYANFLGNYWSDYTDTDANGDGIGDNPYVIDSNNQDNHPLIRPIGNYKIIEKWSFAIITDLHIGRGYPDYGGKGIGDEDKNSIGQEYYLTERLRKVVEWINNSKTKYNIKFVVVLGDISDSGEYSELKKAKEILDELDVPYIPVIGNHDIWPYNDSTENRSVSYFALVFKDQFEKLKNDPNFNLQLQSEIPENPTPVYLVNYNFTYKGINFIALDWVSRDPAPGYGVMPEADTHLLTLRWLEECLNEHRGEPIVLLSHHPMYKSMANAFTASEFKDVCISIKNSYCKDNNKCEILNFGGHIHGTNKFMFWIHPPSAFIDVNKEIEKSETSAEGVTIHAITTEALMVGLNKKSKEGRKGIIRVVNVIGKNIEYESEKAHFEILSLNPYLYPRSSDFTKPRKKIEYEFRPYFRWENKRLCFNFDFGDGTPIVSMCLNTEDDEKEYEDSYTEIECEGDDGEINCDVEHVYEESGRYTINVTSWEEGSTFTESITRDVTVESWVNHLFRIIAAETFKFITFNGMDPTIYGQNIFQKILILVFLSEPKPVGVIYVHFENATEDVDLTNLIAEVNLNERKSILYMPEWPEVIEKSKILFIPSTGKGAVYICKNATSLDEVNLENADAIINVGETKDGMTVLTTYYNGREYYMVLNVTGTGGGEYEAPAPTPVPEFTLIGFILSIGVLVYVYVFLKKWEK